MAYDATFHKSIRKLGDEGPPFVFTPEHRAELDEILTRYPPEQSRSAVLPALYLVQRQQPAPPALPATNAPAAK